MSESVLDNQEQVRSIDTADLIGIASSFGNQLLEGLECQFQPRAASTGQFKRIVISGMGGSAIAGDLLRVYVAPLLSLPIWIHRNYGLPQGVGRDTLVLSLSHSGNTDETIDSYLAAGEAGATTACVSSGGKILQLARQNQDAFVQIPSLYPPRFSLGYLLVGGLSVLASFDLIDDPSDEIQLAAADAKRMVQDFVFPNQRERNPAKQLASLLWKKIPVVYASQDCLDVVARRWVGQICENAKQMAFFGSLPEMNHNQILGWKHPEQLIRNLVPIFLLDREDRSEIKTRVETTSQILSDQVATVLQFETRGEGWLERLLSLILLGDFASLYLAVLNEVDPYPIEAIDRLKNRLN